MVQAQKLERDSLAREVKKMETSKDFSNEDTTYINLLAELARHYHFIDNDSMFSLSKRVMKLSKAIDYDHGKILALMTSGMYYSEKGDHKRTRAYFNRGLNLAKKIGDTENELSLINLLALNYWEKDDFAAALGLYLQGIDLAQKVDDKNMLSIINENIATLYADQEDYDNALKFYDTVLVMNKEIGDDLIDAQTQSNMASIFIEVENYEKAMFNINQSITTLEKEKVYDWLAYAYQVKGKIYLEQKKYKWALYWFDQSNMLHSQELDDDKDKLLLYDNLAKVHLGLGKDSLSMQFASNGYNLSKKINSLEAQADFSETLYELYKKKGDSETALFYLENFKVLSDSLNRDKNQQSLELLEAKLYYKQEKQELITNNKRALAKQRNYTYFAAIILIILCIIIFLTRRNVKIQKKLNKELKDISEEVIERESELHEISRTKTKLFSVIGHDLRGPIGALQGILKLFTDGEIGKDELISFIPKLKSDVENISFALNNLLSWGQSQLNGVSTKPKKVYLDRLVKSNIQLLSEIAASKSIKVINQMPESPTVWADQHHIDIVVRNLLSNAIKFTPDNGLITIEAEEQQENWLIMIRDTGIGMNKEIQKKIFEDTSNITTYGTNNEKGTGLGLSLCKEMIIKNKGKIWVESILRKGSTFFFTVPKAEKKYQQAG